MSEWTLDPQGFVSHYLVSGPRVTPFVSDERDVNLLRFESGLREKIERGLANPSVATLDRIAKALEGELLIRIDVSSAS